MSHSLSRSLRSASTRFRRACVRCESTLRVTRKETRQAPFTQWGKVVREAEKIVGYPTSFMNLRWLLSDEFANVALHLRKLVGSDHPLLSTAKSLLYNQQNNLQPWGLFILLLSKTMRHGASSRTSAEQNELYERQRILAELTEMIRTGHLIHKGLINISPEQRHDAESSAFGNKIGILIGDYLLVTANGMLAKLRHQELSYLISTALRDMSEGEFFGDRDAQNMPLPGDPKNLDTNDGDRYEVTHDTAPLSIDDVAGSARREWTVRALYSGARLLGRGCEGAAVLADQPEDRQRTAFLLGAHAALAWQATSELQSASNLKLSPVSAPVLFALQADPTLYDWLNSGGDDSEELRRRVQRTDAVERTRALRDDHVRTATVLLAQVSDCQDSARALANIISQHGVKL